MGATEREPSEFSPIAAAAIGDGVSSTIVAAPGAGKKLALFALLLETNQMVSVEDTGGESIVAGGLTVSGITNITGLSAAFASGPNGIGVGTLEFDTTSGLRWTAPGGSAGAYVAIPSDGEYTLADGSDSEAFLRVTVTFASLPGTNQSDSVTLAVTEAFMPAGRVELVGGDSAWATLPENRGIQVTNRVGGELDLAIAGGAVYKTLDV